MTTLIDPTTIDIRPTTADDDVHVAPAARTSSAWKLAGVAAGVLGLVATWMTSPTIDEATKKAGVDAVTNALDGKATQIHVGASLGFAAVFALVVFAAGYVRFLRGRVAQRDGLAVPVAALGFAASLGAMVITFGMKAMLAGGIPGSIDAAMYTTTDVSTLHLFVDQLQWLAWQGVAMVIAVTAVLSLRQRVLPRGVGVFSALAAVFVAVFTLVLALPYSAGIVGPIWLVVIGVTLLVSGRRTARR